MVAGALVVADCGCGCGYAFTAIPFSVVSPMSVGLVPAAFPFDFLACFLGFCFRFFFVDNFSANRVFGLFNPLSAANCAAALTACDKVVIPDSLASVGLSRQLANACDKQGKQCYSE